MGDYGDMIDDEIMILGTQNNSPIIRTRTSYWTQQVQLFLSQLLQPEQIMIIQETEYLRSLVSPPVSAASEFANERIKRVLLPCDDHDHDDVCPICLDSLIEAPESGTRNGEKGAVVRTPCDHKFHKGCILRWFDAHATCPCCRHHV